MTDFIDPKWLTFLTSQEFFGMLAVPLSLTLLLGMFSRLSAKSPTLVMRRRGDALWLPKFAASALFGLAICFVGLATIDELFGMNFINYFIAGFNM